MPRSNQFKRHSQHSIFSLVVPVLVSDTGRHPRNRGARQRHPEHQELVVVVQSCVVWLADRDALRRDKIIIGLE